MAAGLTDKEAVGGETVCLKVHLSVRGLKPFSTNRNRTLGNSQIGLN